MDQAILKRFPKRYNRSSRRICSSSRCVGLGCERRVEGCSEYDVYLQPGANGRIGLIIKIVGPWDPVSQVKHRRDKGYLDELSWDRETYII